MKKTLCLLILTVFLSISLCACNKPAYSKPIEAAIQMTYYGNEEFIKYAAPQEYFEWYEKEYDRKFEIYCDDWENDQWLKMFGNDYKVTYEITNEEKVDRDTLDTIKEYLEDEYSIKPSHVKKLILSILIFLLKDLTMKILQNGRHVQCKNKKQLVSG